MRDTGPWDTTLVPFRRCRRTRDMPELRCCLFELFRLNFIATGLPLAEPSTGKKRFLAPEWDLSLVCFTAGRGAAKAAAEVCSAARSGVPRAAPTPPVSSARALDSQGSIVEEDGT